MLGQNIGRVGLPDMSAGGRPSLTLDFVGIPVLNERITFSRTSGATWFSPDGVLEGVDFSTSSVAIGTGSKTFTLTADAGANRYWAVNDLVRVSQQSNSANFMEGTVTSYTASTQVLVIDVTSTGGSGTIASWRVSSHMPRFDYNPSTLAARGLLIEEQRTNSIRNNTMQGAVAGTPGTLPTNWSVQTTGGLTTNVIGTGTSAGVTYIDLQVTGTTTGTSYILTPEPSTQIAALNGQTWTMSAWWSIIAGNFTNVTAAFFDISEVDSGGTQVGAGGVSVAFPTSTFTRFPAMRTNTNAATAFVRPRFRFTVTNGVPVDFTLRIGLPQLELGAFATSVIPTTTTALTRSADVASVNTLSPWFNATASTVYFEGTVATVLDSQTPYFWSISDNTKAFAAREQIAYTRTASSTQTVGIVAAGGTTNASVASSNTVVTANTVFKAAASYAANDVKVCVNGLTPATTASATLPTGLNTLKLGAPGWSAATVANAFYIRRFTYYPRSFAGAELQSLTA